MLRRVTKEDIKKGYKPMFKNAKEKQDKAILDRIYNRSGKVTATPGQRRLTYYAKN